MHIGNRVSFIRTRTVAVLATMAMALFITIPTALEAQSRDELWKRCTSENLDLRIGGCTALIQSGQESTVNMGNAFFNRGLAYKEKGEFNKALEDFTQTIALNPTFERSYTNRGWIYNRRKEYRLAIQDYDRAIALKPDLADAYSKRGTSYYNLGDIEKYIADNLEVIRLTPNYAGAYNEVCWGRVIIGKQLEQALADCNMGLKLEPNEANTLDSRGLVYFKMNKLDLALADYTAAFAADSTQAISLYMRGVIKRMKGRVTSGNADIAAAKKLEPGVEADAVKYGVVIKKIQ